MRFLRRKIFLGRKIWQVFVGWLDLSLEFLGVFKTISRFVVVAAYDNSDMMVANEETITNIQFLMLLFSCYII